MRTAATIAETHHERWDGNGYPLGLSGEEIPVEGRIAAICDVFDALTSARPYKDAWPDDQALARIRGQAGRHFDPELVKSFLQVAPRVTALRHQHPDSERAFDEPQERCDSGAVVVLPAAVTGSVTPVTSPP